MECVIVGSAAQAERARVEIEGADERWRCECVQTLDAEQARCVCAGCDVLYLLEKEPKLIEALYRKPPCDPPWVVTSDFSHPLADMRLDAEGAALVPGMMLQRQSKLLLPRLCEPLLPELSRKAKKLLQALGVSGRLKAWNFLPELLALCAAHSALAQDLSHGAYPYLAARHSVTPACVERRVRVAVESTWNRGSIDTLECFFGQSIDPDKGKPTNKEFICRLCEYLRGGYLPKGVSLADAQNGA